MGTRSLTVLPGDDGETAVLYRQMDGYLEGHGRELAEYLAGKRVVNGFSMGDSLETAFNGASCMAAAIVARFKDSIGGFYLYPADTRDAGEEYVYVVTVVKDQPHIMVTEGDGDPLFDGTPEEFLAQFPEEK